MKGLLILMVSVLLSGCGGFFENLRKDLDERRVYPDSEVKGTWPERGMLGRSPAGGPSPGTAEEARNWNLLSDDDLKMGRQGASGPTRPMRVTRGDFIDRGQNEGSLWASDGQTNYFFTKNNIRGVGDIVTVTLEEPMIKDIIRELNRVLTPRERERELMDAQERINAKFLAQKAKNKKGNRTPATSDTLDESVSAPERGGSSGAKSGTHAEEDNFVLFASADEPPRATPADIDLTKNVDLVPNMTLMAEIVERYPNGNYKIRGIKKFAYRQQERYINLVAIAKNSDLTEEDTITSGKFYEYRTEVYRE